MSFSESSFILKNDGTLWGCGNNANGQLGLGDTEKKTTFTEITTNTNGVKLITCGYHHTFILKHDGTLLGCGNNYYGQLGLEDTEKRTTFTQITFNIYDVKSVYCGYDCTIISQKDGALLGCGSDSYNKLGLGGNSNGNTFTQIIANIDDIKSICYGHNHTLILKNDGTLWGRGDNYYYQLGLEGTNKVTTFTKIADDVKLVDCGYEYTIILKNDNTLWGCGSNSNGQLGVQDYSARKVFTQIATNTNDIKSVYCGCNHTFILKNNGTLWGCGDNQYGQLSLGNTPNISTFTQITNDVKSVYCGNYHTLILKNNGTLWGCGYNTNGELGLGDTTKRNTFTQITTNTDDIKSFANDYSNIVNMIKVYDTGIGYTETLDTNNFRNIPVDKFEKIKVLYANPNNTYLNCLISFDKKQTWKTFDGLSWNTISDISPENIILNGMDLKDIDQLDKNKLISGGLAGDLDFKIAMKTNNVKKTPSVTKIYIEYK